MSKKDPQGDLFVKRRARPVLCKCKACRHPLSDPASVERKLGPVCFEKGGGERWQIMLGFEEPRQ